ncbi:hypothetical protein FSP39_023746 [Pinctada imbricata]|uniref:Uncharacterized protein n=1 Tax=Pinctada imbricata TaxID=66713 RepID=A0AA88Y267_PINIB|nr:hypothetical protein FSP39_023746 [Pinctada imbricata]
MYDFIDLLGSFELEKRFVASKSNTSNKFNIRVPVSLLEMIEIEKKTTLKELIGNHSAFRNKVRLIGDKLSIDENIIRDMFVGVMNEICKHVSAVLDTQEGNEVSLIQMVGGFSESQCVQEIIREKFQSKTRHVLVPQEAGIAVLKGAVIFGHSPNSICSRIIRYTYGNAVKVLFQDGVHDERKRWNDGQKVWCQNVFKPFMKAGTSVEIGHSFVQRKPTSHYETARMKIYVTDNDDIMYVTDEGCRELCNVLLNEVLPSDVNLRQIVKQTIVFGGTDLKIRIQNENTRQSHRMSLKMDVEKE